MKRSKMRIFWIFLSVLSFLCFLWDLTAEQQEPANYPKLRVLDPRFLELVPEKAIIEKIADGFHWVEGPAWNRQEKYLVFSDIPANTVFRWSEGVGISIFLKPSGYTGSRPFEGREPGSNGLTFDATGRLVLCEHGDRRIARLEVDGSRTTLADRYMGRRLNSPNDLVYKSNGDLYFTDPPYGLPKGYEDPDRELDFTGVYRLRPNGDLTLLTKEVDAPNGLAFSPDEKILYVTNANPNHTVWYRFDVHEDGTVGKKQLFFDGTEWIKTGSGSADGLELDDRGNLFATGPGGLHIFTPEGEHLGLIEMGVPTSNCEWGEDGSTLFITADTAIYRVRLKTKGARW